MMIAAFLVAFAMGAGFGLAQSHDAAIAVGEPVVTQINCGESAGGGESYSATITLKGIIV